MGKFSSNKLRSLREQQHLTQEHLAEKCGADTTTISGWENGKWISTLQNALSLSQALHVSVEDLCDVVDENSGNTVIIRQITSHLLDLTTSEQTFILEMVQGIKKIR